MKVTSKVVLALALLTSLSFTSCKDYDEDNYINAVSKSVDLSDLQAKIKDLQDRVLKLEGNIPQACGCDVVKNADGTVTITANGKTVTTQNWGTGQMTFVKDGNGKIVGLVYGTDTYSFADGFANDIAHRDQNGNVDGITVGGQFIPFTTTTTGTKVEPVMDPNGSGKIVGIKIDGTEYEILTGPTVDVSQLIVVKDGKVTGIKIDGINETPLATGSNVTATTDAAGNLATITIDGTQYTVAAATKGDKGDTGDKGDKGDTGDTGAQGPQGEKGADGSTVTVTTENGYVNTITITKDGVSNTYNVATGTSGSTVSVTTNADGLVNKITINGTDYNVSTGSSTSTVELIRENGAITGIKDKDGEYKFQTSTGTEVSYITSGAEITGINVGGTPYYFGNKVEFVYPGGDTTQEPTGIKVGDKTYTFKNGTSTDVVKFLYKDTTDPTKITGMSINGTEFTFPENVDLTSILNRIEKLENTVGDNTKGLVKEVNDLKTIVGDDNSGLVKDVKEIQKNVEKLSERVDAVEDKVEALESDMEKVKKTLKKLVTGIIVQQVYNPAFGSYNSIISNVQTDMLIGYFNYFDQQIDFFGWTYDPTATHGVLIDDREGNAGKIYLTVNPNTVDFTGIDVQLVNSQDNASGITLGKLKKSNELLHFGYTRAADNGFYEVPANLTLAGLYADRNLDVVGNMNIDKDKIITDVKALIKEKSKSKVKPVLADIAKAGFSAARALNGLQALAVKSTYTEADTVKSIYSNYNIAAAAIKPLGFNTVDDIFKEGGQYYRGYDKAKELVTKATKKVTKKVFDELNKQFQIDRLSGDIEDVLSKLDTIDHVTVPEDAMKFSYKIDTTMVLKFKASAKVDMSKALEEKKICTKYEYDAVSQQLVEKEWTTLKYLKDESKIKVTSSVTKPADGETEGVTEYTVRFTETINIDFTKKFKDIVNQINAGFDDTNDLIDAMETLLKDANNMLSNIKNLEQKIEDANYLNRIWKYSDKIADKVGTYAPYLFKPVLFINSDKGFGICGFRGAASSAKGSVTLAPTTYSAETISPILRKAIVINDEPVEVNGVVALDGGVKSVNVTKYLKVGKNVVNFYAIDYYGKLFEDEYVIYYTK